ncbi:hypothetical protein ACQFG6_004150 [Klebsiella michiganensis]|uniref:Uncharacterized protein n=2 Tax=Klebsiella michiganensis TaxID=1134687 RepID=A0AB35WCS3_9ENTR|nr:MULTISPECIES: hypothetical protein [Klebsiella]APM29682.1 hypothetical protein AGH21_03150 [Klebsiella oxytoca]EKV5142070.1 hypothetical protein [Klebsiella michiganensis]EWF70738.1 hypothetical protein L387_02085 [Klebsiella michiganensis]KLY40254.1 hypothetical protein SK91_01819 [Klebsiella michiganensis]MBD0922518.1 hypothetical protein [Klebsiella michiganensis]
MKILYRYDEDGLFLGEIEPVSNPMFYFPDEPIDKGYYDADGNPPKPPVVGQNERAVWIGYRYSIEPEYISLTNTTTISPGEQPEGKFFDGREWK